MGVKRRTYMRFLIVFAVLGGLGITASIYTLVKQRFPLPFGNTYTVRAEFTAADGVASGLGQPVNVVGVNVGQVTDATLHDGVAVVTLQIDRGKLPHVYADASAVLEPITPLKDMQVNLDPGAPSAGPLPSGGLIGVGQANAPVPLSDLLSTLDVDTRAYLTSLIASLGQGTAGRGPDIRRMLTSLGPTTAEAGAISQALAARRTELARLIHNLAIVTRAASQDRQLAAVVEAGDQTLNTIAAQDAPLRQAIAQFPQTLAITRSTLVDLEPFAQRLGPTLSALSPAVSRLPATFSTLVPFVNEGTAALAQHIRPLIHAAQPLVRDLAPTVPALYRETPYLSGSFQGLKYLVNELAYDPNQGDNQGFLFWLSWMVHNFNSVVSSGDANGGIGRAGVLATCYGLQGMTTIQKLLGVVGLCPK